MVNRDTANPGDLSVILLPEGKLDMTTFSLGGLVTTSTSAGFAAIPPVEQLIDQLMVEVGSTQLHPSFQHYNQVFAMFNDLQGSQAKKGVRQILNAQPVSATISANQTNKAFQIHNWLGFLSDCKILNTDRLPQTRIYIRWSQPNVLGGSASNVAGATYSLKDLYCTVDMLKLSTVYDELLSSKINSGSPLTIPYKNWQVIPGTQSTGLTGVVRWSSTSDALEKVYGTFIPTTYQSLNQVVDSVTYMSPCFTRGSPNLEYGFNSQFGVNQHSFPDQPAVNERGEVLLATLQTIGEDHDITSIPHPNLNSLTNWSSKFFVHGTSFTFDSDGGEDAAHRKCGLSALGTNLIGDWKYWGTSASNASDQTQPLVILETKAVLEVGPARSVRVIY